MRVIRQMKADNIKVILVEPWNDRKLADRVADEAGAKALVLAPLPSGRRASIRATGAVGGTLGGAEGGPECVAGARQPRTDRPDRDAEAAGDLRIL